MRVEALGPRPDDDLASHLRRERGVDQEPPGRVAPAAGISRMSAPWYPTSGVVEIQLAREAQRARDHPAGDEADQDPATTRRADRGPGVRSDGQVVADERAVDVERDEPDGQDGFR